MGYTSREARRYSNAVGLTSRALESAGQSLIKLRNNIYSNFVR